MKISMVFPGQGSQHIGMGMDFYNAIKESKKVFEEADDTLGEGITDLIRNGSEEELKKTENTQPAMLATCIAIQRALESRGVVSEYTAGLSLGEYSSLVMSKAMNYSDALRIVRKRGLLMQEAVPEGMGGMLALLSAENTQLQALLSLSKNYGILEVANYNSPEQIVLSGELRAINNAVGLSKELGIKKAIPLQVSAPFHSSLLNSAGQQLRRELEGIQINELQTKLVSNVDAQLTHKDDVVDKLVSQVSSSVLWQQSVENMINEGVDTFIEIGPGKSLSGFIKRISKNMGKEVTILNVSNLESFEKVLRLVS